MGVLQRQRDLVAWKLQAAPDKVLRSAATPSGMDLHRLVRHLTNVVVLRRHRTYLLRHRTYLLRHRTYLLRQPHILAQERRELSDLVVASAELHLRADLALLDLTEPTSPPTVAVGAALPPGYGTGRQEQRILRHDHRDDQD